MIEKTRNPCSSRHPLAEVATIPTITPVAAGSYTKGQFVRLFLVATTQRLPQPSSQAAVALTLEDANDQGHHRRLAGTGADGTHLRHLYRTDAKWRHHHIGR